VKEKDSNFQRDLYRPAAPRDHPFIVSLNLVKRVVRRGFMFFHEKRRMGFQLVTSDMYL